MRYLLASLILLNVLVLHAQDYTGIYGFEPKSIQYVYVDSARLRSDRDANADIIAILQPMTPVTIVKQMPGEEFSAGPKSAPWYEVSTEGGQHGYIWGGALALGHADTLGTDFLYSLEPANHSPTQRWDDGPNLPSSITVSAKAFKGRQLKNTAYYTIFNESINGTSIHLSKKSLPFSKAILVIWFSGEACAIPTYTHCFAWDVKELIPLPPLEDNSDAGVYSHNEIYVFPGDKGGTPGMLLIKQEDIGYSDEADKNGDLKESSHEYKTVKYRWDGVVRRFKQTK